ncbi:MAG: hypothetical protein PHN92_09605 [Geobacter sp.]|nr:hypothetical protein [Geobacter sp.]
MKKDFIRFIALPACVCLGSPVDSSLPTAYAAVVHAVHEILITGCENEATAISKMKEKRKQLGKKTVFSEISLDPKSMGIVRYHPTPFVSGHNIMTTPDADGAYPGKALAKAPQFSDGQGLWIQYSIKEVVTGDKVQRHMYCEKYKTTLYCGSLPASYDLRAHMANTLTP